MMYDSSVFMFAVSTPLLLKTSFKEASCFFAFTMNSVLTFLSEVSIHFKVPVSASTYFNNPTFGISCSRLS